MQGQNQIKEDDIRAMNARRRVGAWTNTCVSNKKLVESLQKGVYGYKNTNHHEFRTEDKLKFKS